MSIIIVRTTMGDVEVRLTGKGKPVFFCMADKLTAGRLFFKKGLDSEKLSFIAPSRPGYGNSPLSETNKSPKGTAALFVALLDELKLSKVIVLGISAGGLTALEMAANYSDRVDTFIR